MGTPTLPEISRAEMWLPVVGWEGFYEVSDNGRVRSVERTVRYSDGRVFRYPGGIRTLRSYGEGRQFIDLTRNSVKLRRYVHHLVLEAFVSLRPPGTECCHWDDDPTNNHVSNLRWDTRTANKQDSLRNGRRFGANDEKTKCPQGHPYNDKNTYIAPSGGRQCRKCKRDHHRKWKAKQR
jgi:NUMOD4 motif/HNH endonuclease